MAEPDLPGRAALAALPWTAMDWEYDRFTLPRGTSRGVALRLLVERAEYGHWELDRLRLYPDGRRMVVLRRRIIRQRSTLRTRQLA